MRTRRIATIAAAGALAAAGGGAAIAATAGDEARQAEDAILSAAAKDLNVTPQALRDALGRAEDAQLDQAVEDRRLTRAQADAIKKRRRRSGRVLGIGPGGPGHHRGPVRRGGGGFFGAELRKALGVTRAELRTQLRAGKSVADIAKAENKDLAAVKTAVRAAVKQRLDQAVAGERITQAQADDRLEHLDEHLDRFDEPGLGLGRGGRRGPGGPPAGPPPGP